MYIYNQQGSGGQSPVERESIAAQSVRHPLYPSTAHLLAGPGTPGIGRDVSLVNIDHVLRMNRQFAESLGWQPYRDRIAKLLGLPLTADDTALAEAVAHWQRQNKLPRTGIINHVTWFRLQIALGLLAPPFPRVKLDENHLTNLLFHARHPERHLAPLKKEETALKTEWSQLRDRLVIPVLRQAPVCEASGPDFEQLADYLRWFHGELKKTTRDPKRLGQLRDLIRLQVKVIVQSLDAYITSGCNEPSLETLRLLVRALPWPNDTDIQAQQTLLVHSIQKAQLNALQASDTRHKKCLGSGKIRIEVRKPKDLLPSFTKDPSQASLASAAIQIFVPQTATEVSQLEWIHGVLEWICPQAKSQRARAGGERDIHRVVWTVRQGEAGMCPLNIVGKERLACDGHTYGLAVKPGSTLRASAEKKGFEMDKCEWKFTTTFRATTSAYNGSTPLARCIWGFQFVAEQSIANNGQMRRVASAQYWGVDKELISP